MGSDADRFTNTFCNVRSERKHVVFAIGLRFPLAIEHPPHGSNFRPKYSYLSSSFMQNFGMGMGV